jgi:tetratricopeptide (TPR) repeat protein
MHVENGRPAQAPAHFRRAIGLLESLRGANPDLSRVVLNCAGSWYKLGEALLYLDQRDEAAEAYRQSLAYLRTAVARNPGRPRLRRLLDERLGQLFWMSLERGRLSEAVELARERLRHSPDDPTVARGTGSGQ